jgi:hypothetical protein
MSHPNYLQIAHALRHALAVLDRTAAPRRSTHFAPRLEQLRDRFDAVTRETDARYTAWRVAAGDELRALRRVRVAHGHLLEKLDEYGFDGVPTRQILYTEREDLRLLVEGLLTFLAACETRWDWMDQAPSQLQGLLSAADEARRRADDLCRQYTLSARERVEVHAASVTLLRELGREMRDELDGDDLFQLGLSVA